MTSKNKIPLSKLRELLKIVELAQWEIQHKEYDALKGTIKYLIKDIKNGLYG